MITGELKNRIDSLWDDFAAGGIVNPLTVIEQITYLMFIHDLDEADNKGSMEAMMLGISHESIFKDEVEVEGRTVDGKQLKWSVFQDFPAEKMFDVVKNRGVPVHHQSPQRPGKRIFKVHERCDFHDSDAAAPL